MALERWLGEWSSPSGAIKRRFFRYLLCRYLPIRVSDNFELELFNGYARTEMISLDKEQMPSGWACLETLSGRDVEVWIAWDKVLAMATEDYDETAFEEAAVTIQVKGIRAEIALAVSKDELAAPTPLAASMLQVDSTPSPEPLEPALEQVLKDSDDVPSEWMKRVLGDTELHLSDVVVRAGNLEVLVEHAEYSGGSAQVSGLEVKMQEQVLLEKLDSVTLKDTVVSLQTACVHLYPEIAELASYFTASKGSPSTGSRWGGYMLKMPRLHITVHSSQDTVVLFRADEVTLDTTAFRASSIEATCQNISLRASQFTLSRTDGNLTASPFRVSATKDFADTLAAMAAPWVGIGGGGRRLDFCCPQIDVRFCEHDACVYKLHLQSSEVVRIACGQVKLLDATLDSVRMTLKNTALEGKALNMAMFHPLGPLPFSKTQALIEDTKFIKCSASLRGLFRQLAQRSQRVVEVRIERAVVDKSLEELLAGPQTLNLTESAGQATLLLVKLSRLCTKQSSLSSGFLSYFANPQVTIADARASIHAIEQSGVRVEPALICSGDNFRATFYKASELQTLAVEAEGLLLDLSSLKHEYGEVKNGPAGLQYFVNLRRVSVKLPRLKDKDIVAYADSLKVANSVALASQLVAYLGEVKEVGHLYSSHDTKWTDAGLRQVAHSPAIHAKLHGKKLAIEQCEATLLLSELVIDMLGPLYLNAAPHADIKSMLSITEMTAQMEAAGDDAASSPSLSDEGNIKQLDALRIEDGYTRHVDDFKPEFPFAESDAYIRLCSCVLSVRIPNLATVTCEGVDAQLEPDSIRMKLGDICGYDLRYKPKWQTFLRRFSAKNSLIPALSLAVDKAAFRLRLVPIKLRLEQDLLVRLSDLFPVAESSRPGRIFESICIAPVYLSIDYQPHKLDVLGVPKHPLEMLNLFSIRDARLTLPEISCSRASLGVALMENWLPTLTTSQHAKAFLTSLTPIRTIVRLSTGAVSLLLLPIQQYREDGRLARGLSRGVAAFAQSAGIELTGFGSGALSTTAELLSHLTDTPANTSDLTHLRQTIVAIPVRNGNALYTVPIAILGTVQGASEALAYAMRALNHRLARVPTDEVAARADLNDSPAISFGQSVADPDDTEHSDVFEDL